MPSCSMPFFMTLNLIVMTPAISMAPQKEISPSPWLKCKSPTLNFAPGTRTGRKTWEPRLRFLISQLPPCSGRPGIVRAPSRPIFSFKAASADPAWTDCGLGGSATVRPRCECVEMSSPSRWVHVSRTSGLGAQPRIPGWITRGQGERSVLWKQRRVRTAGETNAWNMARGAEYAFEVPDGFCSVKCVSSVRPMWCCVEMCKKLSSEVVFPI